MYEDKELKEYRDLLKAPDHFEEGFDWKAIVGAVFIGFLMMPGSMYLQLVIGSGIGPAARWVTIILFAEIAKRSSSNNRKFSFFIIWPELPWHRRFRGFYGANTSSSPMRQGC